MRMDVVQYEGWALFELVELRVRRDVSDVEDRISFVLPTIPCFIRS